MRSNTIKKKKELYFRTMRQNTLVSYLLFTLFFLFYLKWINLDNVILDNVNLSKLLNILKTRY